MPRPRRSLPQSTRRCADPSWPCRRSGVRTVPQSNSCRHGSTSRNLGSDECDVETDRQTTPRLDRSHGAAHSSVAAPTSLASEDAEGSASVPTASLLGPVTRCRCRVRPSPRPGRTSTRTSTQQRDRVLRRVRCTERCAPGCGERPEKRNSHNDCHHVPERLSPTPETDDHQIRRHDSIQRCCGRVDLPDLARTGLSDRHTHLPGLAQSPTCRSPLPAWLHSQPLAHRLVDRPVWAVQLDL